MWCSIGFGRTQGTRRCLYLCQLTGPTAKPRVGSQSIPRSVAKSVLSSSQRALSWKDLSVRGCSWFRITQVALPETGASHVRLCRIGEYEACYYQADVLDWPEDEQDYHLVKRTVNAGVFPKNAGRGKEYNWFQMRFQACISTSLPLSHCLSASLSASLTLPLYLSASLTSTLCVEKSALHL